MRLLPVLLLLALGVPTVQAQDGGRPKNIIVMIPDGAGPSAFTLTRRVLDRPLVLDAHLGGTVSTAASNREVTDSASSATAYACGVRTNNRTVGVDAEGRACRSLLEVAEARGMATGLVTTSYLTDATPSSFGAHSRSRYASSPIAEQILGQGIEVLLGGGSSAFLPVPQGKREDGRNLLDEARAAGYTIVTDPDGLDAAPAPVLGLFGASTMEYEMDRDPAVQPSLLAMTQKALEVLSADPDGFFLLIETEGTDEAGHDNDPVAMVREIEHFDAVARLVLAFAEADGETLVVSVADHDTGGLTMGRPGSYYWGPQWLRNTPRSTRWMQLQVENGADPVDVFRTTTGLDSLSAEEVARFETTPANQLADVFMALLSDRAGIGWSTGGHTAVDVNLYRYGPGSDRLTGHLRNDELGALLLGFLGAEPQSVGAPLSPSGGD